jgi:hypothetical protein
MQELYYTSASASLFLSDPSITRYTRYWDNITSVNTSSTQIIGYSSSTPIAYFPLNNTNLYYPPFPAGTVPTVTSSVFYSTLLYTVTIPTQSEAFTDKQVISSSYFIYDSSSANYIASGSRISNQGGGSVIVGNTHSLSISTTGSYTSSIIIVNTTVGTGSIIANVLTLNNPATASFIPLQFNSYAVTFSITP